MTNREMFLEKLKSVDMHDFVNFIIGYGKCTRCSNYYWDGIHGECHKNLNNSTCEEGIAQFMESKVGENLQNKYHKVYSGFRSYFHAALGQQLVTILFKANIVDKTEDICKVCKLNDCPNCRWFLNNIIHMSQDYMDNIIKTYKENDYSIEACNARNLKEQYYKNYLIFVSEVLIPRIQEQELWIQAKLLTELILKDGKESV